MTESSDFMGDTSVKTVERASVKQVSATPLNSINQGQTWSSQRIGTWKENSVQSFNRIVWDLSEKIQQQKNVSFPFWPPCDLEIESRSSELVRWGSAYRFEAQLPSAKDAYILVRKCTSFMKPVITKRGLVILLFHTLQGKKKQLINFLHGRSDKCSHDR